MVTRVCQGCILSPLLFAIAIDWVFRRTTGICAVGITWSESAHLQWFLPRDAMHSAYYAIARCLSVCLSVCLSDADIVSKRLNMSSKLFPPSSSHSIIVLQYQTWWQYFNRDPPNEGVKCKMVWKMAIFDQCMYAMSRNFGNDTRYGCSYYGMRIGNHIQAFEWHRVTLNPDFKVMILFNVK